MTSNFAIYPSLKGKTVFITGGASGIGADMVRAFVDQGSKVGFIDMDEATSAELCASLSGDVAFEKCDLRDIDQLKSAFAKLAEKLGPATVRRNFTTRLISESSTSVPWARMICDVCGVSTIMSP